MSLKIIMGSSGHGKTYTLYTRIIEEAIKYPEKKYILIVPEQSSLQAQKDIVRMHPSHGVFNIDVLTFGRLSYRIFEELGVTLKEVIDDTGKNLIIRKVMGNNSYKIIRPGKGQGFISEIKSVISEFKQYGIDTTRLKEIIDTLQDSRRLKDKLSDICSIYEEFEKYISDKYVTSEDRPEELLKVMDSSCMLDNAVVAFDGFTGFTPVQFRIIEKILARACKVVITATIPKEEQYNVFIGPEDIFNMSKVMVNRAGRIADSLGIKTEYEMLNTDTDNYRFAKSKELAFLEKELFRYRNAVYTGKVQDIVAGYFDNSKKELQFAASAILREVRENNLRYRDFAIITGDMEMYREDAVRIFEECGIPYFIDSKRSLIGNPLVEYIRSAIQIITGDYTYESIFRFLKNGLCDIDIEETEILENYVLALGIRGKNRWNSMFARKYPGKGADILEINETRKKLIQKLTVFCDYSGSKENFVKDYIKAIYSFMEGENVYDRMEELAIRLDNPDDIIYNPQKAAEYRQSYRQILELLDRIYELMGDETISFKEFSDILDAGFTEIKVGILPPSVDCITIGDVERTRLEHVKVMFVIGMNEGLIPKLASNSGILSENERVALSDNNIELAPMPREKVFIQNFYLYLNMTEPEYRLYLFCHKFDNEGKDSRQSRILSMVRKMFKEMPVLVDRYIGITDRLTNAANSRHILIDALSEKQSVDTTALLSYYLQNDTYKSEIAKYFNSVINNSTTDYLTRMAAEQLYKDIDVSSISRIETFAECAFLHFAKYGLELEERKIYELNRADIGSVFHRALELISRKLQFENRSFADITDEERQTLVRDAVDEATLDFKDSYFTNSSSNAYMKKRIESILLRTVWALGKQLLKGSLRPEMFEHKFVQKYENTTIQGRIDRIDSVIKDNTMYIKVIDYKSRKYDMSYDEIYAGLKLQLLVYLGSVVNDMKKQHPDMIIRPAGAFYNNIDNPIVKYNSKLDEEGYSNAILKELNPTGLAVTENMELIDNSGDKVLSDDHVITEEQIMCLTEFADNKLLKLEQEIEAGRISADPYEKSCDYCPYSSLCKRDRNKSNCRKLEKVAKTEDMWLKFGYKGSGEDDNNGMD